jgi:hypothetical protein
VGLGDLAFFALRGGFGDSSGLRPSSGFDTLCGCRASRLLCLA